MKRLLIILLVLAITPFAYAGSAGETARKQAIKDAVAVAIKDRPVTQAVEEIKEAVKNNWGITPIAGFYIPMGSEGIFQDGIKYGTKINYKSAILKIQRIDSSVRYVGQRGIDLSFNALLLGFEHQFKPTDFGVFGVSIAGGIAVPDYEEGYHKKDAHSEGLLRHSMKQADVNSIYYCSGANSFDKYRVDYATSPIAEIEFNYTKPFKYGGFTMSLGYTYLSVEENLKAIDEPNLNDGWSIIDQLDCSGAYVMVGYEWRF